MQCVRHIGCSSEAASGNVVGYYIGEFHKVTSSIEIVLHTFEGGSRNPYVGKCQASHMSAKNWFLMSNKLTNRILFNFSKFA